jgi:hypothetical protein
MGKKDHCNYLKICGKLPVNEAVETNKFIGGAE